MLVIVPLLTTPSLANGGPDDWTHATPIGSARPTSQVATRLVSEELTVTVGQDYDAVQARAVYKLYNPGPVETVRYAVPKLDELYDSEDIRGDTNTASLKLTLDGKPVACTDRALKKKLEIPFAHRKRVNPAALENPPDEPVYDEQVTTFHVTTACEVELKLAPGEHELVLDVVEEPLHYSWSTSKDKHPGVSDRRWMWLLAPAGSWAGTLDELSIDVDLGPHARTAKVHGEGWTTKGTHRTKTLKKVDLTQAEPLVIDLGVREQDFQAVILEMTGRTFAWKPLGAKASSTLKAQGANRYGPENLIDRDPATAWCEGVDGTGVGEWVQLRYSGLEGAQVPAVLHPDVVRLQMAMLPGYAKSQHTWTTNGRVAKVEVSACDGSIEHELTVPKRDDPRAAMFFTGFGEDLFSYPLPPIATAITRKWAESKKEACIQVRILEVEQGSKHEDTCISELAFLVDFPG